MSRFAVNVGAGDGSPLPGTCHDPANQYFWAGARGVAFEAGDRDAEHLRSTLMAHNPDVRLSRQALTDANMRKALEEHSVPVDLDLLKIDIDSNDCTVLFAALHHVKPKVLHVEYNPEMPPPFGYWLRQCRAGTAFGQMASLLMSCSLSTLSVYLRPMGYTLLYVDLADAVYVRAEYIHHFGNIPRDDATIYQLGWTGHPGYRTFAAMHRIDGIDVPWFDGAVAFEDRRDALL